MIWYLLSLLFGIVAGMTFGDGPRFCTLVAITGILICAFHELVEKVLS